MDDEEREREEDLYLVWTRIYLDERWCAETSRHTWIRTDYRLSRLIENESKGSSRGGGGGGGKKASVLYAH